MNKKIFAIIMVIALMLSSFTLAFANNSDEIKEKKDKPSNTKIHVHIEGNRDDIEEVFIVIDGEEIEVTPRGNSGNYTAPKNVTPVSEGRLTEIIVKPSDGEETTTYSAEESQQGQEGQGSINYRLNVTESDEDEVVEDEIINSNDDLDDDSDSDSDTSDAGEQEGPDEQESAEEGEQEEADEFNGGLDDDSDSDSDTSDAGEQEGPDEQESAEEGEQEEADEFNGGLDDDSDENPVVENITKGSVPNNNTPDNNDNITLTISPDETPLGLPVPQEIVSTEGTPIETKIEAESSDSEVLEDEETPLDIPSTGVTTPLFYGAGALISLVGLLKRR